MAGFACGLAALAVGLVVALISQHAGLGPIWLVAALSALSAVADRCSVKLSSVLEISTALLPALLAAVTLGPFASMLVYSASMIGDLRGPPTRWVIYTSGRAVTGCVAGYVAEQILYGADAGSIAAFALASLGAAFAAHVSDLALVVLTLRLRGCGVREFVASGLSVAVMAPPLLAILVAPIAYGHERMSAWILVMVVPPAIVVQRLYVLYRNERRLAEDLWTANEALKRANLSFASSLVAALDARDRYTAGHSAAVAIYARDIAAGLGLTEEQQKTSHLAGLLHDVGKVGLPPGILEKPGALTNDEFAIMRQHSEIGERILNKVDAYATVAHIVRHHHERWDGRGYPDGVAEGSIPLISRIICVADAYNAMTSGRPYRAALPTDVARRRLEEGSGTQFDPAVVGVFLRILASSSELYSIGTRADFAVEAQSHPELTATEYPLAA